MNINTVVGQWYQHFGLDCDSTHVLTLHRYKLQVTTALQLIQLQYNYILQLKYRHNGNAQAYTVYHDYEGSLIKDRDTWSNALFKASVYSFT